MQAALSEALCAGKVARPSKKGETGVRTGSSAKGICTDCSTFSHSFRTSSSVPPGVLRMQQMLRC